MSMAILGDLITKNFNLENKLHILETKFDSLTARASDITSELEIVELQLGSKRRREVEDWLRNVRMKKLEISSLNEEVKKARLVLPNIQLKNRIGRVSGEVEQLKQQGRFPNGLVLNDVRNTRLPLLTPNLMERTCQQNIDSIWEWLLDDNVCRIGIYGMGGVGKSSLMMHIHNKLLGQMSRYVYWVTITQGSTYELQSKIAKAVGLDLPNEEDCKKRAATLSNMLSRIRKVVLFLDDMWKHLPLDEVGIPLVGSGCKVIITTRSLDVCRRMGCQRSLKVEPLLQREAWSLFLENLGNYEALPDESKKIAELIAEECGGLPLGIRTMARSMTGVLDVNEWNNALSELRKPIRGQDDMENEVFPILEFSYCHLNDDRLQKCFLSCVLYPEDYRILRDELINLWIAEGLLDEIESREEQFHKGHSILNRLENSCLLEAKIYNGERCVKMHDLIRDMGINITKTSPRFMVNPGAELTELPHEQQWMEDLEKVSFFRNCILEIPSGMSPRCPSLSSLFLQYNPLENISESFFIHMKGLTVLNLSHTNIKKLPKSVSDLENLSALLLRGCWNLSYVPSLTRLKKLRDLDMCNTKIKNTPEGFVGLCNLRCLDLSQTRNLCTPLSGILPRFSHLQVLSLSQAIRGKDLMGLTHLERLQCLMVYDLNEWGKFIESRHHWKLNCYKFLIRESKWRSRDKKDMSLNHVALSSFDRIMMLTKSNFHEGREIKLPKNMQFLGFDECSFRVKGLLDAFPSFQNASELKVCEIKNCDGLEYVWSPTPTFPVSTPHVFSHFRKLSIRSCFKIRKLFPLVLVQQQLLPNLLEIELVNCPQMTELIALTEDIETTTNDKDCLLSLPKLRIISLRNMPHLESICRGLLLCKSLVKLNKENCPMLKMISLSLPLLCDSSECTLRQLPSKIEWWASLDKDYPRDVKVLRHLLIKRSFL